MSKFHTNILSLELNGEEIKTTITNEWKVIDDHIWSFLHPTDSYRTKVIGFDIEWRPTLSLDYDATSSRTWTRPATLQLCDGHSCLIVELPPKFDVPFALRNFLRQPNYTFVGYGIKDNFVSLERHCGIGCKNAVELGTLAATLMNAPQLSFCGVDELAFVVDKLDVRKYRPLELDLNWGSYPLNNELAKLATINVYSYHKIGSKLLERYGYIRLL
ncbi:uncharacterized protein LOC131613699 [Vicia villosa]|uniref:uncharacterized protein LOC131613699 n=1 Tax=Vicia villosa TaxID=3911 RepID=UPI00273BAB9C|nr:uncharacterized protein LOC131613699 [Vicia villosa]